MLTIKSIKSEMSTLEQRSIRETLGLPEESRCGQWTMVEKGSKYRIYAPLCRECLVEPWNCMENEHASYIEVNAKLDKIRIFCEQHGERNLRGKAVETLRNVFFGSGEEAEKDETPHERLVHQLEAKAKIKRLLKCTSDKMVYRPIEGCPNAYRPHMSFEEFIETTLSGDRDFRANPHRFGDLMIYMNKYNEPAFPKMVVDQDLLSFSDGILTLSTNSFVTYESTMGSCLRVARHHIPKPYLSASPDTPLFDSIFKVQFTEGDGRLEILYALIGRLFYKIGQLDNWQVMLFILGEGGTGKSTLLSVIQAMFRPGAIGEIDGNNEKTFGLQDKYLKEIIFIRDAPAKMSEVLPQEQFQKMVTGEGIQVSVKYGTAITVQWTAPMITASNNMFNYNDNAGQISRRIALFHFNHSVDQSNINDALEKQIIQNEIHSIIVKCIGLYHEKLAIRKPFWAFCPEALKDAQEEAMANGNMVYRFLKAGPNGNSSKTTRCFVRRIVGMSTDWDDFKNAFDAYMKYKNPRSSCKLGPSDRGTFIKLGYDVTSIKICTACYCKSHATCCLNYSNANRTTKTVIENMELVREEILPNGAPVEPMFSS